MSTVTLGIQSGSDGAFEDESENALFTNALSGILLEAELRAPVFHRFRSPLSLSLSLSLSSNAFRRLGCRIETRWKEPHWKMQSAFIVKKLRSKELNKENTSQIPLSQDGSRVSVVHVRTVHPLHAIPISHSVILFDC